MRLLTTMLFISTVAFAQFTTPQNGTRFGGPNNACDSAETSTPGETATVAVYDLNFDQYGNEVGPRVGASVTLSGYWTKATGYHAHETNGTYRPSPTIGSNDTWTKQTDSSGYVSWTLTIPPISGWLTIQFTDPTARNKTYCFNTYVGTRLLTQFPGNAVVAQGTYDREYSDTFHSGKFLYFTASSSNAIASASAAYSRLENGTDYVLVARGSLPNGGMLDDILGGATGEFSWWVPAVNEEHYAGTEVDVVTPNNSNQFTDMITSMNAEGCYLGTNKPGGGTISSGSLFNYWFQQSVSHFVCGNVIVPRGPTRR